MRSAEKPAAELIYWPVTIESTATPSLARFERYDRRLQLLSIRLLHTVSCPALGWTPQSEPQGHNGGYRDPGRSRGFPQY